MVRVELWEKTRGTSNVLTERYKELLAPFPSGDPYARLADAKSIRPVNNSEHDLPQSQPTQVPEGLARCCTRAATSCRRLDVPSSHLYTAESLPVVYVLVLTLHQLRSLPVSQTFHTNSITFPADFTSFT